MKKITFLFALLLGCGPLFGQAAGTPFIFQTYIAPYVYQNIVTSYDGSTLSGWYNGFYAPTSSPYEGVDNLMSIDNTKGNPSPSFLSSGSKIRTMRRNFGQNFKNKTIEFDVYLTSGDFGFNFGVDNENDGYNGVSLKLTPGNSIVSGLNISANWYYPNNGPDTKNLAANQWYAVKITIGDGSAGTIKWYLNGLLQGTNSATAILGNNQFFGPTGNGAVYNIDNIKITY